MILNDQINYPWGHSNPYNDFSTYFKGLFNTRVQKIAVDAGFTCPNRDGSRGKGGCTFCDNKTFNPSKGSLHISKALWKVTGSGNARSQKYFVFSNI